MSVAACAGIVQSGDPARFRAVMAATPAAREKLFPLYAFNVEIARAAHVSAEPRIVAIRLQWWIDALEEIAAGGVVRRHEVVVPLALYLTPSQARQLQAAVEARFRDTEPRPFADLAELSAYLEATSGNVLDVAVQLLGGAGGETPRRAGFALGLANWFRAVPALRASGRHPLPEVPETALAALASEGVQALDAALREARPGMTRPAYFVLAGARHVLRRAQREPQRIGQGGLEAGPLRSHLALLRAVLLNRW